MKLETYFSITARCKKIKKDHPEPELTSEVVDIELRFNELTAASLLFKFGPDAFKLNEYKCICKYNEGHNLNGLVLADDECYYIVTNFNQVLNDTHNGYIRLKVMDKVVDILEFDFKAGLDFQNPVEDEF